MRYKVRQTETVEYILEATNEEEAMDFLMTYTNRELRAANHNIDTIFKEEIIEKTVMPADFHVDDEIEEILDEWPDYYEEFVEGESGFIEGIPFN
ncbi:hypothetical protein SAMN05216351_1029 [Pseudobutyrivibrio sp. JW11]|uniref:hypothetical protein n=1 Tax=Pseudobutyrivibrio sp. JW11 TaxID=1855302 RepID=UPI0008E57714|nr:hypothetical protein [Pseudobutyrivibrio sp. JW11]SFN92896.1 hypothetical protein SAMN05216351_1029 [Pseudobutyrivibrio sp. JW11]